MKILSGLLAAVLGFFVGVAILSFSGKPSNDPVSLNPVDALSTYFFSFSWVGGVFGTILGAVLLLAYLALWFYVGVRIYAWLSKA
ncbi:hypothetical protein [Marivita sp. S2033]|uniref:hypothetical protein n=1 Tax=Marivita sp. S2033 TaxID=3373187 RepID=UPI003981E7AE